jgi:2-polyprenyl-3-methyl-5-hydroxy-6-metoxy-1,4-benzoquinol methylase
MDLTTHPLTTKAHAKGFIQLDPIPSEEGLKEYYARVYFQQNRGQYEQEYTDEEKAWFRLEGAIADHVHRTAFPNATVRRCLDVGCGEAFVAAELYDRGWTIRACDFSIFGIQKFHPHLLPYFEQGDIYEILQREIDGQQQYELINLANVLEHVRDPEALLRMLRRLLSVTGLLRITVPNDYSDFQAYMKTQGTIDGDYWLTPEHLSYFNFTNFRRLLESEGYHVERYLADHPIEHFLMHDGSNYKRTPSAGKQAHYARVKLDLFYARNLPAYVRVLEAHAEVGMGRDIIAFVR